MSYKNCIYRFFNQKDEIIYIGKAKNLKTRLSNHTHLPRECYEEMVKIEYCCLTSEDELDLAERYLIPKYKPKYNTEFKQRDVSLTLHSFENLVWQVYSDQREDSLSIDKYLAENFDGCSELTNAINELKISVKTLQQMTRECLDDPELAKRLSKKLEKEETLLKQKQTEKAKRLLGSDYNRYSKDELALFIQYDIYNEKILAQTIYDEIVVKLIKTCVQEIQETGYYSLTQLCFNLAVEMNYGLGGTEKWVYWYLSNGEVGCCSEGPIKQLHQKMVSTIEKVLEERFGQFERDLQEIGENPLGYFFGSHRFAIPSAHVVKRLQKKSSEVPS